MTQRTDQSQVRIPGAAILLDASEGCLAQWRKRGRSPAVAWVLNPRGGGKAGPRQLRLWGWCLLPGKACVGATFCRPGPVCIGRYLTGSCERPVAFIHSPDVY